MQTEHRKRPRLVWVVFLYYLVTVVLGAGSLVWLLHAAPDSAQACAVIETITPLHWTLTGLSMAFQLGGAIALFGLRRVAYPLFIGGLWVRVVQMAMQRGTTPPGTDIHGMLIVAFTLAIDLLVCLYARSLRSRSVLI